jgi:hypothetical protein
MLSFSIPIPRQRLGMSVCLRRVQASVGQRNRGCFLVQDRNGNERSAGGERDEAKVGMNEKHRREIYRRQWHIKQEQHNGSRDEALDLM